MPVWQSDLLDRRGRATLDGMETTKAADLAAHWEAHYGATERVWSGKPNQTLVEVVSGLTAGRALPSSS